MCTHMVLDDLVIFVIANGVWTQPIAFYVSSVAFCGDITRQN